MEFSLHHLFGMALSSEYLVAIVRSLERVAIHAQVLHVLLAHLRCLKAYCAVVTVIRNYQSRCLALWW